MRWVIRIGVTLLLLFAAFSAYWFYAAGRAGKILHNELISAHNSGTGIILENKEISGYPLKFRLNTGAISMETYAKPYTKLKASGVDAYSRPLSPAKLHISHKGRSQIDIPAGFDQWAFEMNVERARTVLHQSLGGVWRAANLDIENLQISPPGSDMKLTKPETSLIPPLRSAERIKANFSAQGDSPNLDIYLENLHVKEEDLGQFGLALGPHIMRLEGKISGNAINPKTARIELWQGGAKLTGQDINLKWGAADFGASFILQQKEDGLNGTITVTLAEHKALLRRLLDVGILSSQERFTVNLILAGAVETEQGRKKITLSVTQNNIYLGPILIGKLPY